MLKAKFLKSFTRWDVSRFVIPSMDATVEVLDKLTNKFHEQDVEGQNTIHATISFEKGIAISEYPMAYKIQINTIDWYFKPEYPEIIQYKNADNDVVQVVGDCVYAKYGTATVCFKLQQKHGMDGWFTSMGSNGVLAAAGGAFAALFRGVFGADRPMHERDADTSDDD